MEPTNTLIEFSWASGSSVCSSDDLRRYHSHSDCLTRVRKEPTLATNVAFCHFCSMWDTHLRVVCIFEGGHKAETTGRGLWRPVPAKALTWLMLG